MPDSISTERLRLRPLDPDRDVGPLHAMCADRDVARMTSSFAHPFSRFHAEAMIFLANARTSAGADAVFAIDDGRGLVGTIGGHLGPSGDMDIGYALDRSVWGRGYASEAVLGLLRWATGRFAPRRFKACVFTDNPASAAVLRKTGFQRTDGACTGWSMARLAHAPIHSFVRPVHHPARAFAATEAASA
jgi:RimJ/RimL family protein N-acetyltransferase